MDVGRVPGPVGEGVVYALTDCGLKLRDALAELRRWGVSYLSDPTADGSGCNEFDLHYLEAIDALQDAEFGLVVDDQPVTLRFSGGHLEQVAGEPADSTLTVHTTSAFMDRWAVGAASVCALGVSPVVVSPLPESRRCHGQHGFPTAAGTDICSQFTRCGRFRVCVRRACPLDDADSALP